MEEAVAGTSTVAPLEGIKSIDDGIDVDNLIDSVDPIGAAFDPRTPNTEVVLISIRFDSIRLHRQWRNDLI